MKKILAFLMALALTVSLMPNVVVPAYAASNGDKANPYALEVGVNTFDVPPKPSTQSAVHYFSFTATEAGTLNMTISTNTGRWYSMIGAKSFWDTQPAEQELAAGESFLIGIRVYTDSSDKYGGCAGTITLNVQFTPAGGATEPTEPETEPTEPETEPTEPEIEPTEPETEPTEPEIEPTEPEIEPTEPEIEPTEPETEPTEPSEPEVNYVAQIGEQGYETLAGAFNAAVDGQTVTLLTDLTLGANDTVLLNDTYPSFLIVSDKAVTLDLNGKHITLDMTDMTGTICAIAVDGTGHLTVTDTEGTGSIHGINGKAYSLFTAFVPTAQLTINAGTFELDEASNCLIHSAGSDTVNINGGKFTLGNVGTDVNRSPWIVNANGSNVRHVNINGGSFNANVQDLYWHFEAQLPADKAVSYANGYYTVVDAKVSVTGYKFQNTFHADHTLGYLTLEEAFANAADGATITLLSDFALYAEDLVTFDTNYSAFFVIEDKTITIDLNGYKLLGYTEGAEGLVVGMFGTINNGHLTLNDSSNGDGVVSITAQGANVYALITNYSNCSVVVNGGNYLLDVASDSLIYTAANEGVIVNGGNFVLGNVGTGKNGMPWIFNAKGQNTAHVLVYGGTFNADVQHQYYPFEVLMPKELALDKSVAGKFTVVKAVAYVTEREWSGKWYTNNIGYATLEEAFAACEGPKKSWNGQWSEQEEVILLSDVTID